MLMTPIMSIPDPELKIAPRNLEKAESGSFARHLEKKLDEAYHEKRDMLGMRERHSVKQRNQSSSDKSECETGETGRESLAGLLAEFMEDLKKIAAEKDCDPGEWNVALDFSQLSEICAAAGLDPAELSILKEQAGRQDAKLEIGDLFDSLSSHFENMGEEKKITLAETDLPLLDVFLTQFGLAREHIQEISEAAVRGDGTFDLDLFLQGLRKAETGVVGQEQTVTLTDWEAEQLEDILTKAGVTRGTQFDLLPERIFQEQPVKLSLSRLQNILEGGIQDIRAQEAGIRLPEFLESLGQMLSEAGFESKSVGWSPVVQETANALFQKLQEIVDLSQVRLHEDLIFEAENFEQAMGRLEWLSRIVLEQEVGSKLNMTDLGLGQSAVIQTGAGPEITSLEMPLAPASPAVDSALNQAAEIREAPMARPVQQQMPLTSQLSNSIANGLKNQDHYLLIKLYPADLGEVKVNLHVRDEQVAVSFNMDNSRVKELLESHMQEFRDNMEQKGFTLGECSVSVGQHDDDGAAWQRFEQAWTSGTDLDDRSEILEEIDFYRTRNRLTDHESGISLMV
ncbi:MAG: flagellar hook-length control protein FliK [Thermodesulfobacteriota bacterium]|nr:flagellar hook-length control protein FliK [Thermodesulfobacteriota bacterium]